jgi:N-acetylglucosamine malate deacetylase 1
MQNKSIVVIAAHPDDETLGCGGTIARFAMEGKDVHVVFLADGVGSRSENGIPDPRELTDRRQAAEKACKILGVQSLEFGDHPDNQLDTVSLLQFVQAVEAQIAVFRPDTVITHNAGDLNIDHQRVHQAVITACRPQPGHPVNTLLFFETLSSTEWQIPGSGPSFAPNWFIDITTTLDRKLEAIQCYNSEMHPWPHSRSLNAAEYLARWRGVSAGMEAAEAFVLGRKRI